MAGQRTFNCILILMLSMIIITTVSWAADVNTHEKRVILAVLRLTELWHYRAPELDDKFSAAFYDKYLEDLDPDKLYFLQKSDLDELNQYQTKLDDELAAGSVDFMEIIDKIMQKRLSELRVAVTDILSKPFDYYATEPLKTKYSIYAADMSELKERWRRVLKFHTLKQYVKLLDAKTSEEPLLFGKVDSRLEQEARLKVASEFQHRLSQSLKISRAEKFSKYLNSMLSCYDPHTNYISAGEHVAKITYVRSAMVRVSGCSKKFGYISIPSFYHDSKGLRNVSLDVRAALSNFDDVAGIVLDVRDNLGGAFPMALDVAGLFLRHGPVAQLANGYGEIEVISDNSEQFSKLPLVMLVNSHTASSAEIVAAAFQDYGRAVIVGTRSTYGKGTVQSYFDVGDFMLDNHQADHVAGMLKLTCEKYYRLGGNSVQMRGVRSDVILPELGCLTTKTSEEQLAFAIPYNSIKAVSYQRWRNENYEKLRQRSSKRLLESKAFQAVNALNNYQRECENYNEQSLGLKKALEVYNRQHELEKDYQNAVKRHAKVRIVSENRRLTWQNELRSDIYLEESLRILDDMFIGKWF